MAIQHPSLAVEARISYVVEQSHVKEGVHLRDINHDIVGSFGQRFLTADSIPGASAFLLDARISSANNRLIWKGGFRSNWNIIGDAFPQTWVRRPTGCSRPERCCRGGMSGCCGDGFCDDDESSSWCPKDCRSLACVGDDSCPGSLPFCVSGVCSQSCVDKEGWLDRFGRDCAAYATGGRGLADPVRPWCTPDGREGSGWDFAWGTLADAAGVARLPASLEQRLSGDQVGLRGGAFPCGCD